MRKLRKKYRRSCGVFEKEKGFVQSPEGRFIRSETFFVFTFRSPISPVPFSDWVSGFTVDTAGGFGLSVLTHFMTSNKNNSISSRTFILDNIEHLKHFKGQAKTSGNRQVMYCNAKLRRFRVTIVAVEKK
jgi:hypothetical protein